MTKTETIRVCVSPEEKKSLEVAAERAGLKLSPWARVLLMREAHQKPCINKHVAENRFEKKEARYENRNWP
jgi:hypothetical protein